MCVVSALNGSPSSSSSFWNWNWNSRKRNSFWYFTDLKYTIWRMKNRKSNGYKRPIVTNLDGILKCVFVMWCDCHSLHVKCVFCHNLNWFWFRLFSSIQMVFSSFFRGLLVQRVSLILFLVAFFLCDCVTYSTNI